jgi:peptide/nickel transport system permease protein
MLRYIIRRIFQMIPTVLGVVLITFILFNVAGGSPAAMTLGRHVTPQALEEFDETRGFNKPLLFGWWTATRAYDFTTFERGIGPWKQVPGAVFAAETNDQPARLVLKSGDYAFPLAFALRANTTCRLVVKYRMADGGSATLVEKTGAVTQQVAAIQSSGDWKEATCVFQTGENAAAFGIGVRVAGAPLEIRSIQFHRKVLNPFDSQLFFYFRQLAHLDFGISSSMNQPVLRLIRRGMWPSLALTIPIFIIGLIVAIVIALVCAFLRNSLADRFFVVLSVALMSINYVVWIVVGQYVLAFRLGLFPVWGFASWRFLVLPVIIGTVSGLGGDVRFYRTVMLDEMYKDYVRTAFAKGVGKFGVLFRHVLKNAMIPIVTNSIVAIAFLYTGALLLEGFFGIPGLGYLAVNAINSSDVDVIRAEVLIGSVIYVIANLITDICYAWLDPRVRLE